MIITEFKKGDLITRVKPVYQQSTSFMHSGSNNYAAVGQQCEFIGVLNGLIYYRNNDAICELYEHEYCDNWEYWKDPETEL